jgi:assimilatory nitrate reductase catalytic subunit
MADGSIPDTAMSIPDDRIRTTCPYCGVGCGVIMRPDAEAPNGWRTAGDPEHPANFGRLCSKGSALSETIDLDGRLLHPEIGGARVGWDAALDAVADGFRHTIETHGPDAVAFYLSGQLLTEDYYIANKLMKGFIGSANVDTNSRLCMASSVAGHKRAFGTDTVPGSYRDLDEADLLVLVGSNAAWCHPILFQRMLKNRETRGAKIVVIDPRGTASSESADLVLALKPGTDARLFEGLLAHLAREGRIDRDFVDAHTTGFEAVLAEAEARTPGLDAAAAACGLDPVVLGEFFELFVRTEKVVTLYSQGVNQSAAGTDKVAAILNVHLATGRIGRPGLGPFSLTGQPNAMGGREVGGLANQLAAHMDFSTEAIKRVGRFWSAARMAEAPGLKAVDMFDAIDAGRIKALWVMGTNPAVSLPDADRVRAALEKLDLLVVSENVRSNDTIGAAHIRLPAAAWGEKDGTVTNSERRISRQRAFLALPGEVKPNWWAIAGVARRLGHGAAFAYASAADIYREHAALSAFENDGARDFDIGAHAGLSTADYDALVPFQWPLAAGRPSRERFFADGKFYTPDGRARFQIPAVAALAAEPDARHPFTLNTGRIRDQWHTMTRTGKSPTLGSHLPEPFVEINPRDAARLGIADGDLARLTNDLGTAVLRAVVTPRQQPGSLFVPIHWSAENASLGRVGALVAGRTDPWSGQPEAKGTPAAIAPLAIAFEGAVLGAAPIARDRLVASGACFWASARSKHGWTTTLAFDAAPAEGWERVAATLLGADVDALVDASDPAHGLYRAARFATDGRLEGAIVVVPAPEEPTVGHLKPIFGRATVEGLMRRASVASRSADGAQDPGPTVCACFGVGRNTIETLAKGGCRTTQAIGAAVKAGTNCGSCLPEMRAILEAMAQVSTAE